MMKTIILDIDNLRTRVATLRRMQAQYDQCASSLHEVCLNLQDTYQINGKAVIDEAMDLSPILNDLSRKVGQLSKLLEQRADEIEHEK